MNEAKNELSQEAIEIGLDSESNVTIVVSSEVDHVQSVVMLKSRFSCPADSRWPRLPKRFTTSRRILQRQPSSDDSQRAFSFSSSDHLQRSELLRPESPLPQRSSAFESRRVARERPATRGFLVNSKNPGLPDFQGCFSPTSQNEAETCGRLLWNKDQTTSNNSYNMQMPSTGKGFLNMRRKKTQPSPEATGTIRYKNQRRKNLRSGSLRNYRVDAVVMVADI